MKPFKSLLLLFVTMLLTSAPAGAGGIPRVIHTFVALADNQYQGIIPVPAKIGRGDDPVQNLYWGCDEALPNVLRKAPGWRLVKREANPTSAVMERLVFWNAAQDAALLADAYRGREIRRAVTDFLIAAAGNHQESVKITLQDRSLELPAGGAAGLVAYLGHDGLMDFQLEANPLLEGRSGGKPVIVLCCKSEAFFSAPLARAGARPLLLTTQLMYPGGFLLHAAVEGWLRGENGAAIRNRAARAYAANQGISLKAARGVFASGEREGAGVNGREKGGKGKR